MKKKWHLLLLSLAISPFSYAQTDFSETSRNNAFLEFLGNGGLYSINYERIVSRHFGLRLGLATWSSEDWFGPAKRSFFTVPLTGSLLVGERKSKLELGGGFLFGSQKYSYSGSGNNNTSSAIFNLTGIIGYRYQPANGGLMFRAGLTPFYSLNGGENAYPENGLFLSGGLSIGYNF